MGYVKWSYQVLEKFCYDAFRAFGFSDEESKDIEDVLLMADLYGIESHGMQRMVRYHKGIEKEPSILRQSRRWYLKHRYLQ